MEETKIGLKEKISKKLYKQDSFHFSMHTRISLEIL